MLKPWQFRGELGTVEWPDDLLGPNFWIPQSSLIWDLPKELKEYVGRVTDSGKRFYQKVKRKPAPMIVGDKDVDPDAAHALLFAIDRQDELENAIKAAKEHLTDPLMLWLQERKRSLVKSMQAVVVAEQGELYDAANKEPWQVKLSKMTNEHIDHLSFIFRTVMARIDAVATKADDVEIIRPTYKEAIVRPEERDDKVIFPNAPSVSFLKIDDSLKKDAPKKMCQALLALHHQGRVLSTAWANLPPKEDPNWGSVWNVVAAALTLTYRLIDLVWIERQKNLPKEEEARLVAWLQEKKEVVSELQLAILKSLILPTLDERTIKIDNSGNLFELIKGKFVRL